MKIDKIEPLVVPFSTGPDKDPNKPKQVEKKELASLEGDAVKVAPDLSSGARAAEDNDPRRAERVAAIKEQVQAGTYYVDTKKLAEKLYIELFA